MRCVYAIHEPSRAPRQPWLGTFLRSCSVEIVSVRLTGRSNPMRTRAPLISGEKSRTHLAMHVDHQIVFRAANLFEQIEKCQHRAPSAPALREIAPRKKNDIRERRMAAHDFRVLRRDQPVNPRTRITRAQLHQHRDRMHNIAQRRGLDQQNPRELGGSQRQCVGIPWGFSLTVQLLKSKSTWAA